MYRGCQGDGDGPQFTNLTVTDCSTAAWDQLGSASGAWCSINLDSTNNGNYGEIKEVFKILVSLNIGIVGEKEHIILYTYGCVGSFRAVEIKKLITSEKYQTSLLRQSSSFAGTRHSYRDIIMKIFYNKMIRLNAASKQFCYLFLYYPFLYLKRLPFFCFYGLPNGHLSCL